MRGFRNAINRLLHGGRRKGRGRSWGRCASRRLPDDVFALLGGRARLIIDGGANEGKETDKFLRRYPRAEIHAFEPIGDLVERMRGRFAGHANVHLHQTALGAAEGELSLNVTAKHAASSLLRPSDWVSAYWKEQMDVVRAVRTPVVRLDGLFRQEVDILKLDLQGYELEALKGASDLLPRVKVVMLEVEFVELYEGAPLFADVDGFLRGCGFRLYNIYDPFTQRDGQLVQADAVYLNTCYFPDAERQRKASQME